MDLVNLILMCSLATSPATNSLVYQVARVNNADPTFIDDWSDESVYRPHDPLQAAQMIAALLRVGHELRVGILQIPARQTLQSYGIASRDLVDACTNIAIGSDRLEQAREKFGRDQIKVLAWYLTDDPKSPVGRYWAHEVLRGETVDLDAAQKNIEQPIASREYARPSMRLFAPQTNAEGEMSAPRFERIFPLAASDDFTSFEEVPASDDAPQKWQPVISETVSTVSREESAARRRQGSVAQNKKPQAPVTDERLPTSRELEQGREDKSR